MKRRLLVVSYFFPPLAGGGVHRVLAWTRHLPAAGWEVTVVCAGPQDYWVRDTSLTVPDGVEVIRVAGGSVAGGWARRHGDEARRSGSRFGPLRRLADWLLLPDAYAGWARRVRRVVEARLARGDIHAFVTTSPPDSVHLAAPRNSAIPWVADFRDPWIGLHFKQPPTPWHRAWQSAAEDHVLRRADLVLAASRTHLDALRSRAHPPRACEHLANGFEPSGPTGAVVDRDHFTAVFTGTLSLMEDTATLLDAVHDVLVAHPEARRKLRVVLAGPYDADDEDRARALGLTGIVRFPGALPHAETRALQSRADLLLLWKPRGPGYSTMVPGKLYEYLDSGRPVLALLPSGDEARELIERAGGECVRPGDAAALALALERRYTDWKREGAPPVSRPAWLSEHERSALAGRLAAMLNRLCEGNA